MKLLQMDIGVAMMNVFTTEGLYATKKERYYTVIHIQKVGVISYL